MTENAENTIVEKDGLLFEKSEKGAVLKGFEGNVDDEVLSIPDDIEGTKLVSIGDSALWGAGEKIKKIIVPEGVVSIGDFAFMMNTELLEVCLPESLETLGMNIADMTAVSRIRIPAGVRHIEKPYSYNWLKLDADKSSPFWESGGRGLYKKEEEGLVLCGLSRDENETEYKVKDGTFKIADHALDENYFLEKLDIPEGVVRIGDFAFSGCDMLSSVSLPESLVSIGKEPFHSCQSLHRLVIPKGFEDAGKHAFTETFNWNRENHGLYDITVEPGNRTFHVYENSLMQNRENGSVLLKYMGSEDVYDVPEGTVRIDDLAFLRSDVKKIGIPESVREIGIDAFWGTERLETVFIEKDGVHLYIPQEPLFRKVNIVEGFYDREGKNDGSDWQYDYDSYDREFETYHYAPDLVRMAACRLLEPAFLSKQQRKRYEEWLSDNLEDNTKELAEDEDREAFGLMMDTGTIHSENIDKVIDIINTMERHDLLSYMMEQKHERFGSSDFDFSL